jgi:hypothetical protein
VFRTQFDTGETTRLARHGSEIFDGAVHAPWHVDQIADLDIVKGRHFAT